MTDNEILDHIAKHMVELRTVIADPKCPGVTTALVATAFTLRIWQRKNIDDSLMDIIAILNMLDENTTSQLIRKVDSLEKETANKVRNAIDEVLKNATKAAKGSKKE